MNARKCIVAGALVLAVALVIPSVGGAADVGLTNDLDTCGLTADPPVPNAALTGQTGTAHYYCVVPEGHTPISGSLDICMHRLVQVGLGIAWVGPCGEPEPIFFYTEFQTPQKADRAFGYSAGNVYRTWTHAHLTQGSDEMDLYDDAPPFGLTNLLSG